MTGHYDPTLIRNYRNYYESYGADNPRNSHSYNDKIGNSFSGVLERASSSGSVVEMSLFDRYRYAGKRRKVYPSKLKILAIAAFVWVTNN